MLAFRDGRKATELPVAEYRMSGQKNAALCGFLRRSIPTMADPNPSLTNAAKRDLKARAQRLEPILKVGHAGVTPEFLASLDRALTDHELVKVRFSDFKEEKKTLTPLLAEKSGSEVVMRVGNVAVFFRRRLAPLED